MAMTTATNSVTMAAAAVAPNYSDFLTETARARKPSPIRALMPLLREPGMISLGAGLPNPATFPLSKITIDVNAPGSLGDAAAQTESIKVTLDGTMLDEALQYSATPGLPRLVDGLTGLMTRYHGENASAVGVDRALAVTTGSQDALTKAFAAILGPGESLLLENPSYSGALAYLQPAGVDLVDVELDELGLVPDSLEAILEAWPEDKPKPKALYTIVTGQNPSGATLSAERKARIYDLACAHDFLILEDDPYYFLTHPPVAPL